MCDLCERLRSVGRVFRDELEEPFIILNYGLPPSPTVITREHIDSLTPLSVEEALVALKEVACRMYGNHFYLTTEIAAREREHWHISSRRLSHSVRSHLLLSCSS